MAKSTTPQHSPSLSALPTFCQDLDTWARSWRGDDDDVAPGQRIVEYFRPFLLHLAASNLSQKTIRKHVDNLWMLGGEIIRDLNQNPKLRKKPVEEVVYAAIEGEGPLLYHGDEEQQRSLDSTCRKFRRFIDSQGL
jgi:hypothetical protein